MNLKVTFFSLLAIVFVFLSFFISWYFILGAVVFMLINQKELFGRKKSK